MKVLLFEPAKGGHHLIFVRYMLEDLNAGGHSVFLGAEGSDRPSDALRRGVGPAVDSATWVPLSNGPGRWVHGKRLDAAARAQRSAGADLVFFNCFDEVSSSLFRRVGLGLPPPAALHGRVAGIFVRPRVADAREKAGALKRRGFARLVRSGWFKHLFILDETLEENLNGLADRRLLTWLPDPWEGDFSVEKQEARRVLGLPPDKFLYLHYGTSSRRKGLPTVLKATANLPDDSGCALVAAGRVTERDSADAELLALLTQRKRAYLFDRYIEDAEEALFFRACDAVVLAYEGHYGSSNVQARAAAAGRPVISSDEGLVGERTRRMGIGRTFETRNPLALRDAIAELSRETRERYRDALADYAALHSRESYRDRLLKALAAGRTQARGRSGDRPAA